MRLKTLKITGFSLIVLALSCGTLLAQNRVTDFRQLTPSLDIKPFVDTNASLVTIYSNIGPSATDEYQDTNGYCVTGTTQSTCGTTEQWIAMPFTPAKNSHATVIEAAIQFFAGTNQFQLALYNDVGGAPGASLKTVEVRNAPAAGTCCTLVSANLGSPGIALTAGTQYWVVATSDDTHAATFSSYWAFTNAFVAYNPAQAGWTEFNDTAPEEAGVVKGTVP